SSFLDWRIGLPASRGNVGASVACVAAVRSRKARMASSRFLSGTAAQSPCAARARSYLVRTEALRSSSISAIGSPVAGLMIFIRCFRSMPGAREEVIEDGRVVEQARVVRIVEFRMPLHAEHVRRSRPAQRLDQ